VVPGPEIALSSQENTPKEAELAAAEEKTNPFAALASLNKTKPS
jgi:hypothetical protein